MGKIGWRKAAAALDRADKRTRGRGRFFTSLPRARRGLVPGFIHATAAARHSLENFETKNLFWNKSINIV